MSDIFALGASEILNKTAAGNPAAPQKSSLDGMERKVPSLAAYLNQGGGSAQQQVAGDVQRHAPAWPGYVNHSKGAPEQTAGNVGGRGGSPDTGDLGMGSGGDMTVTKSAAFVVGFDAVIDAFLAEHDDGNA